MSSGRGAMPCITMKSLTGVPGEDPPGQPVNLLCVHSGLSVKTSLGRRVGDWVPPLRWWPDSSRRFGAVGPRTAEPASCLGMEGLEPQCQAMPSSRSTSDLAPPLRSCYCMRELLCSQERSVDLDSGGWITSTRMFMYPGPGPALGHTWDRRGPRGQREQAGHHWDWGRGCSLVGGEEEGRTPWHLLLCSLATSLRNSALPLHPEPGLERDKGASSLLPAPTQTTATCRSKHVFFKILSCLKDVHGWGWGWDCTQRWGDSWAPSDFARFCISAHDSDFCRKGVKVHLGLAPACGSCLWLPLSTQDVQPLVLTSTTVAASSPRENRDSHNARRLAVSQPGLEFQGRCPVLAKFTGSQVIHSSHTLSPAQAL